MDDAERSAFQDSLNTFTDGVINRLGTDIAQQWTQAGIDVTAFADPNIYTQNLPNGTYEAATAGRSKPGSR